MLVTDLFCLVSVRPFVITRIADVITSLIYASVLLGLYSDVKGDATRAHARSQRADRNSLLPLEVLCSRELKNVNIFL